MELFDKYKYILLIICILIGIFISLHISGFEDRPILRYGGVNVEMRKINDTMPIITYTKEGISVPNSYSYVDIVPSIDGVLEEYRERDTKQPDNNPTAISNIQIAKNALV
jgi:hypothetical protein